MWWPLVQCSAFSAFLDFLLSEQRGQLLWHPGAAHDPVELSNQRTVNWHCQQLAATVLFWFKLIQLEIWWLVILKLETLMEWWMAWLLLILLCCLSLIGLVCLLWCGSNLQSWWKWRAEGRGWSCNGGQRWRVVAGGVGGASAPLGVDWSGVGAAASQYIAWASAESGAVVQNELSKHVTSCHSVSVTVSVSQYAILWMVIWSDLLAWGLGEPMMTLQLSACSFKCQNKPQDHSYKVPLLHSYKVPLLPLLLPAAARCLIFFPRLTPMHAPPGMPHFYMHAPPRGGLIFLPCLTTTHAPPPGGGDGAWCYGKCRGKCEWRVPVPVPVPHFFPCLTTTHAPPRGGGMASFATASGEASAVPHFFFLCLTTMHDPPQGEGGRQPPATYNGLWHQKLWRAANAVCRQQSAVSSASFFVPAGPARGGRGGYWLVGTAPFWYDYIGYMTWHDWHLTWLYSTQHEPI